MSSQKLKNAPLKEVIFELHWKLTLDDAGIPHDLGFELALGKLAEKLKPEFPKHRKLPIGELPIHFIDVPIHQYWKGDLIYPVIQHGKGMIAINEVESGYIWTESYRPLILSTINKLVASYETELKFNKLVLKYVDAIDLGEIEAQDFVRNNLQTEIRLHYQAPGVLRDFHFQQIFELMDSSLLRLNIATGINNQTDSKALIWTTIVEKNQDFSLDEIEKWIDYAHDESSAIFKTMLNPDYYASLDR